LIRISSYAQILSNDIVAGSGGSSSINALESDYACVQPKHAEKAAEVARQIESYQEKVDVVAN